MSDFRAIGGVSASLQTLLQDRMELPEGVSSPVVTISTPRFGEDDTPIKEDPRVNLFLYRVSENEFLDNREIPGSGSSGAYGYPPLSLNLHYLLTAFGSQPVQTNSTQPLFNETQAHFLLGSAMRVLHDYPILTDQLLTVRPPTIGTPVLHESLIGAYEMVKLTLEPISLEDVTKVWMALSLRYRLSAAYSITVVQIESKSKRTFPRPVGAPATAYPPLSAMPPAPGPYIPVNVYASPFIEQVLVRRAGETREQAYPYARVGDTLILLGSNFSGGQVRVALDNVEVPVAPTSTGRIEVLVPDQVVPGVGPIPPADVLQPGARTLAVIALDPSFPQGAVRSNDSVFMLVPGILSPVTYAAGPPRSITVQGTRLSAPAMTGETIIGRSSVDQSDYVTASPTQVVVPIADSLPTRGVRILVSTPLPDPFPIPANPFMSVTIGAVTVTNVTLSSTVATIPLAQLPQLLIDAIQNAAAALVPMPDEFVGLKAGLFGTRLVLVPGGLTATMTASDPAPGVLAGALGLTGPQPAGANNGYLSGDLSTFPVFPGPQVGLSVQLGAGAVVPISFPAPTYLDVAASSLQTAIQSVSPGALVGVVGTQLLVLPGAAADLTFTASPTDALSVLMMQLHAMYNVRVRVNGADSLDNVTVELPR
jgi:Pvc16 N-terminal domain